MDADRLFAEDRAVLTGAGSAAGIDPRLHLVDRDHGAAMAARSGLGSGESLRQHLNRRIGMTPAACRNTFARRP
ncbi:hypothetical protein [Streptomyces filamentosus]|uniref:hypothetical protein n=1 Tax=Streptomyces filamentosus TaxID=67294 RepID=UPI001BAE1847